MPLIQIKTNTAAPENAAEFLKETADEVAKLLGKPPSVMMSEFESGRTLLLGGSDDPAALIDVEGIGLNADQAPPVSAYLFQRIEQELGIPPSRVFIKFYDVPRGRWAGNGKIF